MKTLKSMLLSGILVCCAAAGAMALDAGLMPGERAEAPSPEAEALWKCYTDALAAGDWSTALYCVNVEHLRASLLTRRLSDLRAQNPGLSADDLTKISGLLQERELAPERVRGIITDMWSKAGYEGATWTLRGWRDIPEMSGKVWIARAQYTLPDGSERDHVVGLREGEGGWEVDLDAVERFQTAAVARGRGIRVPPEVPLPDAAAAVSEGYWTAWKAGDLAAAWALMSPRAQQRRPLEEFTLSLGALSEEMGIPAAWTLQHCRSLQPHLLGLGYEITANGKFQALMILVEEGDAWSIEDVQVRREAPGTAAPAPAAPAVPAAAPAAPAAPASRPFATDLGTGGFRTDFQTPLSPAP